MEGWRGAPTERSATCAAQTVTEFEELESEESMRSSTLLAIVCTLSGCGAAQLAMRSPISNQCASTGLKGCPELTDGVMEYVGGDRAVAEKKLRAAAAASSPEKLRVFASALEPIGSSIGGDAGAALKSVAAILGEAQVPDAPAAKASAQGGGTSTVIGRWLPA
jgi:hypothetical protein